MKKDSVKWKTSITFSLFKPSYSMEFYKIKHKLALLFSNLKKSLFFPDG